MDLACQAPPSVIFPGKNTGEAAISSPGYLNPGIQSRSPALEADSYHLLSHQTSPNNQTEEASLKTGGLGIVLPNPAKRKS